MFEELGRQAGKLGKQLGDLKDILSTDHWSASPSHKEKGTESRQRNVISPKSLLEHDESKEAILQGLDAQYYQGDFDSLLHELQQLPVTVDETALEAVCEARTSVLEVVSELLSVHVLQHYDKFVEGINQISTIEEELQQAHIVTKTARSDLAMTLHDVQCNIRVAHQTRRKQAYISLLDVLLKLQQANNLHIALKEAQESGEYAQAFWLCAQCCQSMETLQELRVAEQTNITINRLYEETTQRLENALQAVCTEFRPDQFCKVLEGYMFLGNTSHLGGEVTTCFTNVVNTSGLQVVRGIILTRPGFEERAKSTTNLQELVKWLPSDLFRTALARVLMHEIHINTAVEHLQEIELLEQEEVEWGEVLKIVQNGLVNGRRFLWDEAARKIGILLSSPAAFEGEHFLQVSEWVQRILCAGEAFSGLECTTLRNMLATQSGNFFRSFHASNLEALNSMLEKELWRRLPTMEGLPSIATALRQPTYSESLPVADVSSKDPKLFAHWASAGNPWRIRRRRSPAGKRPGGVFRLGFAGSTVLDEDRASKRLEVDEHGLPRRVTNDIWSNGTSRRTTAESDVGTIGAGSIFSEDEAEELYADYIDEDSQRARQAGSPGGVGVDTAAMTNSSMKMMKWMRDYGELMRILRPAPFVYAGLCELFELYMLHTFHTFSEVSLADLANEQAPQATSSEAVSTRLRNTLLRIMSQSLVKYKNITLPGQRVTSAWQNLINSQATVQPSGDSSMFQRLKEKKVDLSRTSMSQAALQPATAPPVAAVAGAEATTISNSGNLWGLQERTVAVESLMAVAHELKRAKHDLQSLLTAADYQSLEHFFSRTVEAAQDLEDCILRTGARFNLPIKSIVDRIAGQNFNLSAPPAKQSAWVDELCLHLTLFRDRMAQVKSLSAHNVQQLWRHAIAFTAEVILDGIAKVRSRCSAIGRNQMAADLQEITFALRSLAPQQPELAVCIDVNIRLVDNYIKAFFIPSIPDLEHWVQTHPEYSREQLVLLATAMAEFMGMKKKDKAEFLAQIQEIIM
ncbi:hypothetical protein WJX72_011915 [[Myrmecia] bisecta]|uniref:Exocyst complex component Sec8 n=1 Tax=[Myrmecia] bisecta TaxID=41462 RepID=A0AAW1Q5E5_9CHLO